MNKPFVVLANQCAQQLEAAILSGDLVPGQRLDPDALCVELHADRPVLAAAFLVLDHDGLVEHDDAGGIRVRSIGASEARQVMAVRRHLELGTLDDLSVGRADSSTGGWDQAFESLAQAIELAERAQAEGDWREVGTANVLFHLAIVELGGNAVAERTMRHVVSQIRLRHLTMGDGRHLYDGFLGENRRIGELIASGDLAGARHALSVYLVRVEKVLA